MVRVCKPGGRVTVADVFTNTSEQAAAYDQLEQWRDPSHTHALQLSELEPLFAGLKDIRREFYKYPVRVDDLLSRSFPDRGGADAFRAATAADIGVDKLGVGASRQAGGLHFAFPVVIISGRREGPSAAAMRDRIALRTFTPHHEITFSSTR
ncbi:hypothetical protein VT84_18575 [Gemmata sp. SH-PL17]|nr:hypothetical protein VT84_18575 [Gemmata sp. SH-PL17]